LYKKSVKKARSFANLGRYQDAICYYKYADGLILHESVSFDLFAELAILYDKLDQIETANKYKKLFNLGLAVYTDVYQCQETDNDFEIVGVSGGEIEAKYQRHTKIISDKLCWPEVSQYLTPKGMERLEEDARLYQLYTTLLEIKQSQ
jgi:hypothetical protein